jgi:hypothetical protein
MLERALRELQQQTGSIGASLNLDSMNAEEASIRFNISGVSPRNAGDLYSVLEAWNVQRVDLEPADIPVFMGGINVFSIGIARGLQSRIPGLVALLTELRPDEVADAVDKALTFISNDVAPEGTEDLMRAGALQDLANHKVIELSEVDPWESYNKRFTTERHVELRPEFRDDAPPAYRGAFEDSF